MTSSAWIALVVLSLASHCLLVIQSRLIQHPSSLLEDRYSPDADIEAFMRRQAMEQSQHNSAPINDKPEPQYIYSYEESPPGIEPHYIHGPVDYGMNEPIPNVDLEPNPLSKGKSVSHSVPETEKVQSEQHLKPAAMVQPKVSQVKVESDQGQIRVESRSSAGHLGANEVMAVAPGLPEALMHRQDLARSNQESIAGVYLLAVIAGCAVAAVSGLALTGLCWYRIQKRVKDASDVEYPAYGVTGPAKEKSGPPLDRKLAQSAQMYHYQHQKQQMIASERLGPDQGGNNGGAGSEAESDEECEEGDYTVFECPGLATAGEMEVRNPLFNDQTPVATPAEK